MSASEFSALVALLCAFASGVNLSFGLARWANDDSWGLQAALSLVNGAVAVTWFVSL